MHGNTDFKVILYICLLYLLCSCLDAPTCAQNQRKVYGIAKQEDAKVMCTVDANPREVEFSWTFNNSAESIDVATNHILRSGN